MSDKPRQPGLEHLPDFLRVSVQKGIVDLQTAQRIELLRRSRGLGTFESGSSSMDDPPEPQLANIPDSTAKRFKDMLAEAENEKEQALALQIALGERIRQIRTEQGDVKEIRKLEQALELLRENRIEEAIRCVST